ncbi:hypothetical protein [uncultured Litoreibacter sp.]|uniref:hypothetical protein n=1 Tax=uncultured Litoreibacter sp. TaxID=1392394 RepID=UPI0026149BFD|nr:hypothetical protein [uncultured Litoreibacter sp.]
MGYDVFEGNQKAPALEIQCMRHSTLFERLGSLSLKPAFLIVTTGVISTFAATDALSRTPNKDVIRVSCVDQTPPMQTLCQTLIQMLSEQAPKKVIRRVERSDVVPTRPNDIGLDLAVSSKSNGVFSGRIGVFKAGKSAGHYGSEVRMTSHKKNDVTEYKKIVTKLLDSSRRLRFTLRQ